MISFSVRRHCGQQIYSLLQANDPFPFIWDATVSHHGRVFEQRVCCLYWDYLPTMHQLTLVLFLY